MEMSLNNGFCEMSQEEKNEVSGGSLEDVLEKVNPLAALEFIYQVGQDVGAASVKMGRECYDLYCDLKKIF